MNEITFVQIYIKMINRLISILSLIFFTTPVVNGNDSTAVSVNNFTEKRIVKQEKNTVEIFEFISAKSEQPATVEINWALKCEYENKFDSLVIRYRNKLYKDNKNWKYTLPIAIKNKKDLINDLSGGDEYEYQIGVPVSGQINDGVNIDSNYIWSEIKSCKIKKSFNWFNILVVIGALGFFIYGMKIMSEGVQKVAGNKMRQILSAMTSNRVKGVFTGFLTTTLVQSSSATTVMVVSFVNAGLITLTQSISVIMGANIGTTVTGWLVSLLGFKIQISVLSLPLFAVAFPMLFSKHSRTKSVAEFLIGFALLFMGLDFLKESMPDLKSSPQIFSFLQTYSGAGIGDLLLAILIGTIATVVIQSSSAAMALTLILCDQGYISFEMAAGFILGENIGTTITANLAAIVANTHAKRAALAHSIFNVFGVFWMLFLFNYILKGIDWYMINYTKDGSPFINSEARPIALSIFHSAFNILNALILIWFVEFIAKIVTRIMPSKKAGEDDFHLEYIHSGIMKTPELAILEAKKEIAKYGIVTARMSGMIQQLLVEQDQKVYARLISRIKKYEEITDRLEIEIANYLAKVSENEISQEASQKVRAMLSISNDLERIGDIFYQMSKVIERKVQERIWFTPEQRANLKDIFSFVDRAFKNMQNYLESENEKLQIEEAYTIETEINKLRNKLKQDHLNSIESGDYNIKSGQIYTDLFQYCEKVGDHILNVCEAVAGKI